MRIAEAGAAAAACMCILQLCGACDDPASHPYVGRLYVEARDCLAGTSAIDVVEGADPGACPPACLVRAGADGGRAAYVSTMCAPYPPLLDTSGAAPICARALLAHSRSDSCLPDGGSAHPPPPADAAPD